MKQLIVYCVLTAAILRCSGAEESTIKTPLGTVMGRHITSYEGRTVTAFEGIPYAKPPIEDLRFKEPQPVDPWTDTLIANRTYVCMQYTAIMPMKSWKGNEDCLYLYVYVPRKTITGNENLDVVVHIHGGAFIVGDPRLLAGPQYLMDRDVVYVNMNYRLGILGFLSTEDEVVPGNNGLKDQVQALKWVKENIVYFGGNPNSVTLTGLSAGAACAHFHYFSPLSKGLFHRGLSQSGTALNPWALATNPSQNARKLGHEFGCNTDSSEVMINCLREVPVQNLTVGMSSFFVFNNGLPSNSFAPVIEPDLPDAFLSDHPYRLLMEGKFNDYPWINSNTRDEGIVPVGFFVLFRKLQEIDRRWEELLPYSLDYYNTTDDTNKKMIADMVKKEYLDDKSLSMTNIMDLIKIHSDRLFLVDSERAVRLQAKAGKSPVYYYLFDYNIDAPVIYKATLRVVGHGDDARLLFHQHDTPSVLSSNDHKMKDIFIDLLFKYASTGVPTVKDIEWTPISSSNAEINYMQISSPDDIRMTSAAELGKVSFWDSLPLNENARLIKN